MLGHMSISIQEKVCVVTGAARSIGLAIAEKYCQDGAKVAMIDINPEVTSQADRLSSAGATVKGYIVDITDQQAVFACFDDIEKRLGPVFALVNNAGLVDQRPFEENTPEQIDKIMRVNVNGTIYCSQGALKSMKSLGDGRIINFSSKSGKTGSALMAPYSAAKGAIIALTHAMAFEFAGKNIKINCVCPGITDATGVWSVVSEGYTKNLQMPREEVIKKFTAKVPLGRLTEIEDIVEFVYFLTVHGDYCTGQAFNITGGREMH
ncbi:acetoin/Diacetyl reductase [Candidatus Vecturithrix granuli]|uniref:Acetoin/Diacetyl reductase n=1 Tax=Vecturithrix granuli TaxID=1499967 RepID=A0A0S6WA05_VECG1|nr:acetoin/Diacetyl reductase [Candidatus Vecturithrix granuli]